MPPPRKRKAAELDTASAVGKKEAPSIAATAGPRRSARSMGVEPPPTPAAALKKPRATTARAGKRSEEEEATAAALVPGPSAGTTPATAPITIDLEEEQESSPAPPKKKAPAKDKSKAKALAKSQARAESSARATAKSAASALDDDHRASRWRAAPPISVAERMDRCRTQRMFVLAREPVEGADPPEERFKMAGTTGNVYTVHVKNRPDCTCPDGKKNGTCKHILYVMMKVLRAHSTLVYQIALTNSELRRIFAAAPTPGSTPPGKSAQKPLSADDCPICFSPFDDPGAGAQPTVYCRAMCGSNIHRDCFQQWARSRAVAQVEVTCVMCRAKWEYPEVVPGEVAVVDVEGAKRGREGYVNVAEQLGLSQRRSYNPNAWKSRGWY